jgi:UDP-glucose 6-dehydrogenase
VAVGYDQNKSQRLPISRYSLNVNVIGLGTTGAVSGIGLAALGHKVMAVDRDQRKVDALNQGRVSSTDSKLKALVKHVRRLNNLVASCDLHNAILSTDLTMVCLGSNCIQKTTPGSDNMALIVEQISATLTSKRNFHLIVICQPTARVTTQNFMGTDIEQKTGKTLGKDFGLCFIPLVLSKQHGLSDFFTLPNMTITASDTKSENLVGKLFNGFDHKIKYVRYKKM